MKSEKIVSVLHPQIKVVGGAMKQMLLVADVLSKNNKVTFYTFSGKSNDLGQNHSFSIYRSFSNYPLKFLSFLIIAWKIRESDYIFCGNSPMHLVACVAKIILRSQAKIIWWNHHFPWYYEDNAGILTYFKKIIERYCIGKVDTIVGNSRFLTHKLTEIFRREIHTLYPLIDEEFQKNRAYIKKANKDVVLFAAGRWEQGKGGEDLYALYKELILQGGFKLIIAGAGKQLETIDADLKKHPQVQIVGHLSKKDMRQYYKRSDIFLFLSKIDSYGLVVTESLSLQTPVIAYNEGEAPFLIQDGENGFCFNTLKDILKKLRYLEENRNVLEQLQQTTKKSIVSNYSMKHFEERLLEIIFEK